MKSTSKILAAAIAVVILSVTVATAASSETFSGGVTLAELFAQARYGYVETDTDCPETDFDCESASDTPLQLNGNCGDSLYWSLNIKNGSLDITGTGDMYDYSPIEESPWREYRRNIKSVTIESGATSIGSYAFEDCPNLRNVTIPEGMKSIGAYAFIHCKILSGVNIPDSVTALGNRAFYGCTDLLTVEIGSGIKKIEEYTFFECEYMQSLTLSEGLEEIGDFAFSYCRMLPSLTIPDSVKFIGYAAFDNCHSIRNIKLSENLETIGGYAFNQCTWPEEIVIPNGCKRIGCNAFASCPFLRYVHIPASVTSIGLDDYGSSSNILYDTNAIICSNTENCYAKKYAYMYGIEFFVCDEEHTPMTEQETTTEPTTKPSTTLAPTEIVTLPESTASIDNSTTTAITAKIRKPSVESIAYGDGIILHAEVSPLPDGWSIEWKASNDCFEMSVSETESSCTVTPKESGSTVFSIIVTDSEGNVVSESEPVVLNAKAGLFHKILAFFKKLFGLTKILPEMIR